MLALGYGHLYAALYVSRQFILDKCHSSRIDLAICTCIIYTVVLKIPSFGYVKVFADVCVITKSETY
jgi:hypothetical protein